MLKMTENANTINILQNRHSSRNSRSDICISRPTWKFFVMFLLRTFRFECEVRRSNTVFMWNLDHADSYLISCSLLTYHNLMGHSLTDTSHNEEAIITSKWRGGVVLRYAGFLGVCIQLSLPSMWRHRYVNISLGNGVLSDDINPLPEPMLIYHQKGSVTITRVN